MITSNIILGQNVTIDASSSINNVKIGDNVKISLRCNIYGSSEGLLEIGDNSYIGMNTILNGYSGLLKIGMNVSIAQNVILMCDSGPNASAVMQKIYPLLKGDITIGDHTWIGAGVIIQPGVSIGSYCVIAANSFVDKSFPAHTLIGGTPARIIKKLDPSVLTV